jgi:hypothetical protein
MGPAPNDRVSSALLRALLSVGVWSLYAVALVTPAIQADEGGHACTAIRLGTLPGWETLLFGWVTPLCIPWSANLLLVAGWGLLVCRRYRAACWVGAAAALAGLTTLGLGLLEGWKGLLAGYFVWQACLILFATGALVLWRWFGESERAASRRPAPISAA